MNNNTLKWIEKANGDYRSMLALADAADGVYYDNVCFLAQQCIEKLLKAILIERDQDVPKIHDLQKLLNVVVGIQPILEPFRNKFIRLTRLSAEVRYPYESAGKAEADFAVETCQAARKALLTIFGNELD
jgi:HEPN domain-containing protein